MSILEEFGKEIVEGCRDDILGWIRTTKNGESKSSMDLQAYSTLVQCAVPDDELDDLLRYIVDSTIFQFLYVLQESRNFAVMPKTQSTRSGLQEISDGLAGEYVSEFGWSSKFSRFPSSPLTR